VRPAAFLVLALLVVSCGAPDLTYRTEDAAAVDVELDAGSVPELDAGVSEAGRKRADAGRR